MERIITIITLALALLIAAPVAANEVRVPADVTDRQDPDNSSDEKRRMEDLQHPTWPFWREYMRVYFGLLA